MERANTGHIGTEEAESTYRFCYTTSGSHRTLPGYSVWVGDELDAMARSTIRLHLAESVYFTVLDCPTAHATWLKLCNTYEQNTPSNKVFLMRKLFNLRMKENGSVAHHSSIDLYNGDVATFPLLRNWHTFVSKVYFGIVDGDVIVDI